ncbi:MAG TPA: DUF2461 domain-containing protein [Micropepsaceae bacterium]|nr:DUF2461 domain-containing protein [Micropepsaceae bacterium]
MTEFRGFSPAFFTFFRNLKANNERAWFEINKERFRGTVQVQMSEFIAAMAPELKKISKEFIADPRPNGGSMFRIHRDVRFSRDKRPYKEHAACQFRHRLARDVHAPGFYVHLAPGEVFVGGGLWMPEADALARIRGAIVAKPGLWKKAVAGKTFVAHFGALDGESLIRPPRGFDPNHPLIADLKRKSFVATRISSDRAAQAPAFLTEVTESFRRLDPLMAFLCKALDVPY